MKNLPFYLASIFSSLFRRGREVPWGANNCFLGGSTMYFKEKVSGKTQECSVFEIKKNRLKKRLKAIGAG